MEYMYVLISWPDPPFKRGCVPFLSNAKPVHPNPGEFRLLACAWEANRINGAVFGQSQQSGFRATENNSRAMAI
jgi:hypothetical protein